MNALQQDIRFAVRMMARAPGLTLVVVAALALGIGANTAIFSVVNAVLLRPLSFRDEHRLVQIWGSNPAKNVPFHNISYSDLVDWRRLSRSFESMSGGQPAAVSLTAAASGGEAAPERISAWRVNANFFSTLGVNARHGRTFLEAEGRPGAGPVALLSHKLWQRRFASDPKAVGGAVLLDGASHTVVGVLPENFEFPGREVDAFTPLRVAEARAPENDRVSVSVFGRLRPGADIRQAQAEMDTVGRQLGAENPRSGGTRPRVWGLRQFVVREVKPSLMVLAGAVGLVLLIACANVANLLLARSGARQREIAVRTALGAGRRRLVRQMLTESVLLAAAGGAAGVVLAYWGVKMCVHLAPAGYPFLRNSALGAPVLAFTAGLSLATAIIFGLAPALVATKAGALHEALKEGSRGSGESLSRNRFRAALVVGEVALALVLLAGAGLLIRSFARLNSVSPGFDPKGVLTASITLPPAKYPAPPQRVIFYRQLMERLSAAPGVQATAVVSLLPLSGSNTGTGIFVEGRPYPRVQDAPIIWMRLASGSYFRAMNIPLKRGRLFTERDDGTAPPVAIINETLARRHWPNEDPVGKRFATGLPRDGSSPSWITVVGVVGDLRHMKLNQEADAEVFWPYTQPPLGGMNIVVRTSSDAARFAPQLRAAVAGLDRDLPLSQVRNMEQVLANSIAPQRFSVWVLGVFAGLALALAAVGVYGVMSFSVTRRTREIGIRAALGAGRADVLKMVVGQAMALAGAGLALGLAGAFALTRLMRSMLYEVAPTDPLVFAGVAVTLAAVAALASYIPARRAARVDPLVALRYE